MRELNIGSQLGSDDSPNKYEKYFRERQSVNRTKPPQPVVAQTTEDETNPENKEGLSQEVLDAISDVYFNSKPEAQETSLSPSPYTQRDVDRHHRIIKRAGNKVERIKGRINKNLEKGDLDKVAKLRSKLDDNAASLGSDISDSVSADWGAGAVSALGQAPGIVANLSQKPTTQGEAKAKALSSTMQFAQIGGAILPGWGHLIGAATGFTAGVLGNKNMDKKQMAIADAETDAAYDEDVEERMRAHFDSKTAKQMKAQYDTVREANGYSRIS